MSNPSDKDSNTADEAKRKRDESNARKRARYAVDPEYRAMRQKGSKERVKTPRGREQSREGTRRYREREREKIRADPEYAAKARARAKEVQNSAASKAARQKWLNKPGVKKRVQAQRKVHWRERMATDPTLRERVAERARAWGAKNREHTRDRYRQKLRENPQFRVAHNLRVRLRIALRRFRAGKATSAVLNVGCTIADVVEHIEAQWLPGMSWENYGNKKGQWSLDHIRPLSSFDLTDPAQQAAAVHFSNLQPLWHEENLRKWASYTPSSTT